MQKIASVLVLLTLFGAALAGCMGEDTSTDTDDDTGGDTGGTTNETANETANETVTLTPMTADEALAFMASGEDGEMPDPTEGLATYGMRIAIVGPMEMDEGAEPMDTAITITQMVDAESQRVMNGMLISMMGGMMNMEMTEIQGLASDGSGNGIVNIRATQMGDDMTPGGILNFYAIDHDWDFESVVADILDDPEDDDDGGGDIADGNGSDGMAEPELGFPDPDMDALAAANWTTTFDETAGLQTFTSDVDMGEEFGTTTITMVLVPSDPPMLASIEMDNGSLSQTIEMLTGDAISIDLVEEETAGWIKGASDMELMAMTDSTTTMDGLAYGAIEVPTSQLELHILGEEAFDENGNEIPQELLGNFSLADLEDIMTWTDVDGAVWTITWIDVDEDGLVSEDDALSMSTSDETNASFDVALYDTWAEDYTGSMNMPGFTAGLSLVAVLGACLLLRRRQD